MKCTCSEIEAAHGHHFGCSRKSVKSDDLAALVRQLVHALKKHQPDSGLKSDDLAALVRQLVHALKKHQPDSGLAKRALDYLCRHGLQGSLLRTEPRDADEDAYVIDKLGRLLAEIAVIVNGPEPPLTRWSYHDLPDKVRELKALTHNTRIQRPGTGPLE